LTQHRDEARRPVLHRVWGADPDGREGGSFGGLHNCKRFRTWINVVLRIQFDPQDWRSHKVATCKGRPAGNYFRASGGRFE